MEQRVVRPHSSGRRAPRRLRNDGLHGLRPCRRLSNSEEGEESTRRRRMLLSPLLLLLLVVVAATLVPCGSAFVFRGGVPTARRAAAERSGRRWSSQQQQQQSPSPSLPQQPQQAGGPLGQQQDMVATLEQDGRFTRLVGLIKAAGMEGALREEGPWTLLAPSDAALNDAGFNLTLSVASREPQRHLGRILAYHVIPGRRVGLTELVSSGDNRSRVKTLERSGLSVVVYGGSILVDDTRITEWGLEASNGVIHLLDGLLLPAIPGFDPFTQAQDQADGPLPGVTPPLGFFDPLGLWEGKGEAERARLRTAELKHGRLAMLAAAGILGQELLAHFLQQPGSTAAAAVDTSALSALLPSSSLPLGLPGWAATALALAPGAAYEAVARGGGSGSGSSDGSRGQVEFWSRTLEQESPDFEAQRAAKRERREMESKELNNGRLAMIAVVGMLMQEAATGRGLFSF